MLWLRCILSRSSTDVILPLARHLRLPQPRFMFGALQLHLIFPRTRRSLQEGSGLQGEVHVLLSTI